jgi:hypothetical protein
MKAILALFLVLQLSCSAIAQPPAASIAKEEFNPGSNIVVSHLAHLDVTSFGAVDDGKTDSTAAFQKALDEASNEGGVRVYVPPGRYLIKGHLSIPPAVTLMGPFDAPPRGMDDGHGQSRGAILLATEGKGDENGEPFVTLHSDSHLHGLIVYYPEQSIDDLQPYPWTVRGDGDNCTITACLLVNPWQAVDFGTRAAGRHYINGLYAHALKTGLFVDQCFDVGRVENVHFWPFWKDDKKLEAWTAANGTAFRIGRTDWEYMNNCFCIFYSAGFHFVANKQHGPGNAVLTQCGSDVGPLAVKVDAVQDHAGVSFSNSQFMSRVEISPTNKGPVKFTSCGFWGNNPADETIHLQGTGQLTLNSCHFSWNTKLTKDAPVIRADSGSLTVTASEFLDTGPSKTHISLGPDVSDAIITANRFRSAMEIVNRSGGDVVIANNVGTKPQPTAATK